MAADASISKCQVMKNILKCKAALHVYSACYILFAGLSVCSCAVWPEVAKILYEVSTIEEVTLEVERDQEKTKQP